MCLAGQPPPAPASAADAAAAARAALGWLAAGADPADLTTAEQADCLRALEHAHALHTAARARLLAAFHARCGYEDDGHGSPRAWLKGQCQMTDGAAAGAVGWMRRLKAHPAVADALAGGEISESWARTVCDLSDKLPEDARAGADQILLGAAAGGATLADLAALAEEIRGRTARPDRDRDGFADRSVRLGTTLGGAGRLTGDLTPQCAAAVTAVFEALGKRSGPEDRRSPDQIRHDALEEACRRLVAAGGLPDRAGQPTQIMLQMTLDQLRGLPGADAAETAWAGPAAGPGYDCDATIVPVVTGDVDPDVLDQLAAALLHRRDAKQGRPGPDRDDPHGPAGLADAARRQRAEHAIRQLLLARAADLLSGPRGLAAYLRTGLLGRPAASVSLPLDTGAATETIPAHLRRLVILRDRCCRFPGCDQPPAGCQPHHIIPRSESGPTRLTNLLLLCTFHHLVAVHRWGWRIALFPDGTVTATSRHGDRVLRSHSPPPAHAA